MVSRRNVLFDFGDFEITKREILTSISIIAIMLLIGLLIGDKIADYQRDQNEVYNKAVKIESQEIFEYGMRTNVGNAFVYGDLEAVDTVTYPEIGGAYMYVEKVEEHYNKHTRRVSHTRTVNGKSQTYYTTEVYWSWDYAGSESLACEEISFLGVVFDANKIEIPGDHYIDTIKESSHVRYKYYGVDAHFSGTIFADLRDNTIQDDTPFYDDLTIEETVRRLESGVMLGVFWIVWVVLICVCVFIFYRFENRWLE